MYIIIFLLVNNLQVWCTGFLGRTCVLIDFQYTKLLEVGFRAPLINHPLQGGCLLFKGFLLREAQWNTRQLGRWVLGISLLYQTPF